MIRQRNGKDIEGNTFTPMKDGCREMEASRERGELRKM